MTKLISLSLILYLMAPAPASADCAYLEGPNEWGWDDTAGVSCEPLNIGPGNPGVRVAWDAIPQASQTAITYIVEMDTGGGMYEVGRTQGVEYFTTLVSIGVTDGSICARVIAVDNAGNRSDPSPQACVTAVQILSLDSPKNVNIVRE